MRKNEFVTLVTKYLKDIDVKKSVSIKARRMTIKDSDGREASFKVKEENKKVIFVYEDVEAIVDACLDVIENMLRNGESLTIKGFGDLYLHYRAPRHVKQPGTEDWKEVKGRLVPKFDFGNRLRRAAMLYGMDCEENGIPLKTDGLKSSEMNRNSGDDD